jgi:hypothetical protein
MRIGDVIELEAFIGPECWNIGILECWKSDFTHHSIIPLFQNTQIT